MKVLGKKKNKEKASQLNFGNFISYDTKHTSNKGKNTKIGLYQLKGLSGERETIEKANCEMEKNVSNHITNKGIIQKICKERQQLNNKTTTAAAKTNNQILK